MNEEWELMLAEESAVAEIQSMATRLLRSKNLKRNELAERMGVSASYVSQILTQDDPKNLSIKKAANLFYHLGEELRFSCEGIEALDAEAYAKKSRQKALFGSQRMQGSWFPCNSNDFEEDLDDLAVA